MQSPRNPVVLPGANLGDIPLAKPANALDANVLHRLGHPWPAPSDRTIFTMPNARLKYPDRPVLFIAYHRG
jgi:hypothetical protein